MGNSEEKFWLVILQVAKLVSGLSDESLKGDGSGVVDPVLSIISFFFCSKYLNFFQIYCWLSLACCSVFMGEMFGGKISQRGLGNCTLLCTEI